MTSRNYRAFVLGTLVIVCAAIGIGATSGASSAARSGVSQDHAMRPQQPVCAVETLKGGYAFSITGSNIARNVQYMFVGQFTSDGAGGITGKGTHSIAGQISRVTFTGNYTVGADCSGSSTVTFQSGVSSSMDFVIADGGRDVRLIMTGEGTLESGSATPLAAHAPGRRP